jgi:peptide/nickel transport system substrate-binding protein
VNDIEKRTFSLPGLQWAEKRFNSFSTTGTFLFSLFALVFIFSGLVLAFKVNASYLVEVPRHGGILTEGVIGAPRFINPLLAVTDGDKDLVALVYSGLMRRMPDGKLVPDLAESYTISSDGKTYDFILKKNSTFHDGKPVTADDVIYTVTAAQDPETKSPKRILWVGVTAAKVNDYEITFTLARPYAQFLDNTILGILPQHILGNTPHASLEAQNINAKPIGSGPYKISSMKYNAGIPVSYTLSAFSNFALGEPFIKNLVVHFYGTEEDLVAAYQSGEVMDINSISPDRAYYLKQHGSRVVEAALPRSFALFFNQKANPVLEDGDVREALAISVDREYIVNTALQGFGAPLLSAVPERFAQGSTSTHMLLRKSHIDVANAMLEKDGWKMNSSGIREYKGKSGTTTLSFSITTSDAPELRNIANILKRRMAQNRRGCFNKGRRGRIFKSRCYRRENMTLCFSVRS